MFRLSCPACSHESRYDSTVCPDHARAGAFRVFDVNLRQAFYSTEILADSMKLADIVKLNHDELPRIMGNLRVVAR